MWLSIIARSTNWKSRQSNRKKQNQMRAAYGSPSETVLKGKTPYRFYS